MPASRCAYEISSVFQALRRINYVKRGIGGRRELYSADAFFSDLRPP